MIVYAQGQIGNQLFGLACALHLSEKSKHKIYLLLSDEELYQKARRVAKRELRSIGIEVCRWRHRRKILDFIFRFQEKWLISNQNTALARILGRVCLTLDPPWQPIRAVFKSNLKNTVIRGYFQDPDMVEALSSKSIEIICKILEKTKSSARAGDQAIIGVHLRRGDYCDISEYGTLSFGYFQNIISKLAQKPTKIYFASDDVECLKTFPTDSQSHFLWPELYSPLNTIEILSAVNTFIMSNSTFSFWIGWHVSLNGGTVIAPRPWFKSASVPENYLYLETFQKRQSEFD